MSGNRRAGLCQLCERSLQGRASTWRLLGDEPDAVMPKRANVCTDCADEVLELIDDHRRAGRPVALRLEAS